MRAESWGVFRDGEETNVSWCLLCHGNASVHIVERACRGLYKRGCCVLGCFSWLMLGKQLQQGVIARANHNTMMLLPFCSCRTLKFCLFVLFTA